MDLPGLTRLLDQTRVVGGVRVLYRFTYTVKGRAHAFDSVLMAEDPPPWPWLVAHVGSDLWSHTFQVQFRSRERVLWTNPHLGEDYDELVRAVLGLDGTGGPWPSKALLEAADLAASREKPRAWVPPQELPAQMRAGVEDEHKIAFLEWRSWPDRNGKDGPSPENQEKTARLLGADTARLCRDNHVSSCWTTPDNPKVKHFDRRPDPQEWRRRRDRSRRRGAQR